MRGHEYIRNDDKAAPRLAPKGDDGAVRKGPDLRRGLDAKPRYQVDLTKCSA